MYETQREIVRELNGAFLGKIIPVLIEGEHEETELLIEGRHFGQAPDIDGKVIINDLAGRKIEVGDLVYVEITEVLDYDLVGKVTSVN